MKMLQEIKLVIKENNRILETVTQETDTRPSELVKTLQKFQQNANAAITVMIERSGDSGETMEASDEDESEDEDHVPITPKKRKK